jgi:hypothetical protein
MTVGLVLMFCVFVLLILFAVGGIEDGSFVGKESNRRLSMMQWEIYDALLVDDVI